MRRALHLIYILSVAAASSSAQTMTYQRYQLADERQLWASSANAAALSLDVRDSADNRGLAGFSLHHRSGSYHRVQEGSRQNELRFFTERYQKIGRYLSGYGSFDFDMGRISERAWSDVLRSYNSNPFISGSAIPGSYDHQNFTMNARLASIPFGRFSYGASLYYKVGDLSRLRDPRSRVRLADYKLAPAVAYTAGRHTLGLTAWYHRYKEKLVGLTTVQTDPHLKYYLMSGMEYAQGSVGAYNGYSREYVCHKTGGELSYGFRGQNLNTVAALACSRATEYAYGQYKYEPGRWQTNHFSLSARNRLQQGCLLHSLDAAVGYEEGYADQYNQELLTETSGAYTTHYWQNKMTYRKRHQMKKTDIGLRYRLSFTDGDEMTAFAGVGYDYEDVSNKHLLPTSQLCLRASDFRAEGGYGFLGRRLWLKAEVTHHLAHRACLQLARPDADYAVGVLTPDMDYYRASYWQGRAELLCQQPLTIRGQRTLWFVKLYGSYLKTDSQLDGKTAGMTIGLYY